MAEMRTRDDGTRTYTTPEWDAKWYWPIGTRVSFRTRTGSVEGVITKQNPVSVHVTMADGASYKVPVGALVRL